MNHLTTKQSLLFVGLILPISSYANVASTLESINALSDRAGYQVNDVILTSELQRLVLSKSAVQQGHYALMGEVSDSDNDNTQEAPAARASITGFTPPSGGGFVPTTSISPKTDGYGMPLGYCVWDHGTDNVSTNRISGDATVSNNNVSFVLLSSGKDRAFNTTCAAAQAGTISGDDIHALVTVGQANYGVATNEHFGKPVASQATLLGLDTTNTKAGEMRMVLDTGLAYGWLDLNADGIYQWEAVSSYFYSGDTNGTTAGGQYTTNPYNVGIGQRFSDRSLVPDEALEVDGNLLVDSYETGLAGLDTQQGVYFRKGFNKANNNAYNLSITTFDHNESGHADGLSINGYDGISFSTGADTRNERMRITQNGRIGIGTDKPTYQVQIDADSGGQAGIFYSPSDNNPSLQHYVSYDGKKDINDQTGMMTYGVRPLDDSFQVWNNDLSTAGWVNHLSLTNTGRMGLGKKNPTDYLQVTKTTGNVGDFLLNLDESRPGLTGSAHHKSIAISGNNEKLVEIGARSIFTSGVPTLDYFFINANKPEVDSGYGHVSPDFVIDETGNIGIGTLAPVHKLQVQDGSIRLQGDNNYVAFEAFRKTTGVTTDDDLDGYEYFGAGVTSSSGVAHVSGSQGLNFHSNIDVNGSPQMHLSEAGDFGIGTITPQAKLDVNGNIMISGSGNGINWASNPYGGSGDTAWIRYIQDGVSENTELQIGVANDLTDNIGFYQYGAERLTIDNGRIGINNTNPQSSLDIVGDIRVSGAVLQGNLTIEARGTAYNRPAPSYLHENGAPYYAGHERGLRLTVYNPNGTRVSSTTYDTHGSIIASDNLATVINGMTLDQIGVLTSSDAYNASLTTGLRNAAMDSGLVKLAISNSATSSTGYRIPYAAIFQKSSGQKAYEQTGMNDTSGLPAMLYATIKDGTFYTMGGDQGTAGLQNPQGKYKAFINQSDALEIESGAVIRGVTSLSNSSNNSPSVHYAGSFNHNGTSTNGYTLQTNIDGPQTSFGMHTIKIQGYAYGNGKIIDFTVGFYSYPDSSNFRNPTYINNGSYEPGTIQIATDANNKVLIHWTNNLYYPRFYATYFATGQSEKRSQALGWTMSTSVGSLTTLPNYRNISLEAKTMRVMYTANTGELGWKNSPISIRERGLTGSSDLGNYRSPNLNFHWGENLSKNLWMDSSGVLNYGSYDTVGNPRSDGSLRASSFITTSDRRKKKNIHNIQSGLDTIKAIEGVTYQWKDEFSNDQRRQYGFIAQDLMKTLPDAVVQDNEGYYSVKYDAVTPFLVEAVKELDEKVDDVVEKTNKHDLKIKEYEIQIKANKEEIARLKEKVQITGSQDGNISIKADNGEKNPSLKTDKKFNDAVFPGKTIRSDAIGRFYQ